MGSGRWWWWWGGGRSILRPCPVPIHHRHHRERAGRRLTDERTSTWNPGLRFKAAFPGPRDPGWSGGERPRRPPPPGPPGSSPPPPSLWARVGPPGSRAPLPILTTPTPTPTPHPARASSGRARSPGVRKSGVRGGGVEVDSTPFAPERRFHPDDVFLCGSLEAAA